VTSTRFTWTLLFLSALLLGSAWIVQSRETVSESGEVAGQTEAPVAGHLAPDFTLTTLSGEEVTLSDFRGRQPVVLNFWATWCPPCRAEIPFFQSASRKYNGQVAVLGVDDGELRATVAPFVTEMGMTYPVPLDEESVVSRRYRVNSLPSTYFIGRDGVVEHVHIGIISQAVLEEQIEALLGG